MEAAYYYTDTYRYYDRLNQIHGIGIGTDGVINRINTGGVDAALLQGLLDGTADTPPGSAGVRYGSNHQAFEQEGVQLGLRHLFDTGKVGHELIVGVRQHDETTRNAVRGVGNVTYDQINGSLALRSCTAASPQKGEAQALSVWIADRIVIGNLALLPILRYEDYEIKANLANDATPQQIADRQVNSLTSTTLGLGANYRINDAWTVLAGVHEGFAPPGTALGTKGDESLNFEGGIRWRGERFGIDAIAFFSEFTSSVRDCLVANPCTGGVVTGTEDARAKDVYGLELGLFGELYRSGELTVPVRLSLTLTDGEYTENRAGGVQKGDVLDYTPRSIGALQVGVESGSLWRAYATLNHTASSCIDNTCERAGVDSTFLETESLFTLDVSAAYRLSAAAEVYAKVDNVFDERKITHRGSDGARGNPAILTGRCTAPGGIEAHDAAAVGGGNPAPGAAAAGTAQRTRHPRAIAAIGPQGGVEHGLPGAPRSGGQVADPCRGPRRPASALRGGRCGSAAARRLRRHGRGAGAWRRAPPAQHPSARPRMRRRAGRLSIDDLRQQARLIVWVGSGHATHRPQRPPPRSRPR